MISKTSLPWLKLFRSNSPAKHIHVQIPRKVGTVNLPWQIQEGLLSQGKHFFTRLRLSSLVHNTHSQSRCFSRQTVLHFSNLRSGSLVFQLWWSSFGTEDKSEGKGRQRSSAADKGRAGFASVFVFVVCTAGSTGQPAPKSRAHRSVGRSTDVCCDWPDLWKKKKDRRSQITKHILTGRLIFDSGMQPSCKNLPIIQMIW